MRALPKLFLFTLISTVILIAVSFKLLGQDGMLFSKLNTHISKIEAKGLESMGVIYRSNEVPGMTRYVEAELSREIKKALAINPKTSALNLSVNISGSRVTLSGKAESKDQIYNAIKTTLQTPGIKEVISTVVIDPDVQIAGKGSLL